MSAVDQATARIYPPRVPGHACCTCCSISGCSSISLLKYSCAYCRSKLRFVIKNFSSCRQQQQHAHTQHDAAVLWVTRIPLQLWRAEPCA
jgi:hypothetical protein